MNKLSLDNQIVTDVSLSQEIFSRTLLIDLSTADTKNRYISFWEHESRQSATNRLVRDADDRHLRRR